MKPSESNCQSDAEKAEDLASVRIAICCQQTERAKRYAAALRSAGYTLAMPASAASLLGTRALPGLIDLLICDSSLEAQGEGQPQWEEVMERTQPNIGTIAVTALEDPRWIVRCVRRGALNCHLASEEDQFLVEMVDECLERQRKGIGHIKTAEERRSARLAARLREAIENEIIDVHFQPIVDCRDWKTKRVEALARWSDGTLGYVTPTEFIATAEDEGLVEDLGRLILRKSIAALHRLRERGHRLQYSVNISRRQFDNPQLVKDYQRIVQECGEDPSQITFEVTETAAYENDTLAIALMKDFIDAGFELAVDDFGTGESSFIQMSHVKYDELKIDRSLVACIFQPAGLSIMRSVIAMAKALQMRLVAEGVEDLRTAELLRSLDIDFCQGYFFAKPMPVDRLIEFLEQDGASKAPEQLN